MKKYICAFSKQILHSNSRNIVHNNISRRDRPLKHVLLKPNQSLLATYYRRYQINHMLTDKYRRPIVKSGTLTGSGKPSFKPPLTKNQADDLILRLTPEERNALLISIQEYQSQEKQQQLHAEISTPEAPTYADLRYVCIHSAVPFIGFGFLDNFIMIVAGDYIDITIGTALGITTMAAAALGNTVSDVAGIGSAWYVENVALRVGLKPPSLSRLQMEMPSARWATNIGRALGVTIGCLLGMLPLLFLRSNKDEEKKKKKTPEKDNKSTSPEAVKIIITKDTNKLAQDAKT